jgi:hypothetical protein
MSTSSVFRICREAKIVEDQGLSVFMSLRKSINIPKTVTNLDSSEKDVCRTMFKFYDRGEFSTIKEITLSL